MRRLCSLEQLPEGTCLEFRMEEDGGEVPCFLLRHQGLVRAYRNRCPHTGAPLNWNPDVFLNLEGTHIQCDIHNAQFRIQDGQCLHGPCLGRALEQVAVLERDGEVWLAVAKDIHKA